MKMVLATPLYPPQSGGPATYARLLEEELPRYGIQVVIVKFGSVLFLPPVVRHFVYFCMLLISGIGARVLFVQDTVSAGLPAVLASRVLGIPLVLRVPGDFAWEQGVQRYGVADNLDKFQKKTYSKSVELLRKIQQFVVRSANSIVVPSLYFKNIVSHWGTPQAPIHVIYHGVLPLSDKITVQSHIYQHLAVTAGRLVPWKGFEGVIDAVVACPEWHLVIVGGGPYEETLREKIRTAGVEDRVHLIGEQPRDIVLGWCQAADVFVLNSSFESFSFQIVEAMAVGVPIIATNIGSIPELITDKKDGLLISPNDTPAIVDALRDLEVHPEVWLARQRSAKVKALEFNRERMIDEIVQLLKAL
ncbi:MAG: glycosyltransferase family 4 protein [Candidatus Pacebacteria bacterium]|nr:glycosyltransferase family 4 protein [Candidatus Paceibacterota bacterium]